MPIVSQFYGIIIKMYYDDTERHHTPHLHAIYAGERAVYDFNGNCIKGKMPIKQEKMIIAWIAIHVEELDALWKLTQEENKFFPIEPLR
jgi:hypothetical protein